MANYVTNTSDKTKKDAKKRLLIGGVGLHYFYVGRIKAGVVHLILGAFLWMAVIGGIFEKEFAMTAAGAFFLIAINLFDFIQISMGKFKDNVGNFLRE